MNRAKFLVFAVVAVGLWGYHLTVVSHAGSSTALKHATAALNGAPAAVGLRFESRRSEIQSATLRLSSSSSVVWAPSKTGKTEAPALERFNALRAVATEGWSESLRAVGAICVVNEAGALIAKGSDEPAAPESIDLASLAKESAAGKIAPYQGVPYLFFATPIYSIDKSELRVVATAMVGLPLLPTEAELESLARALSLSALGITVEGAAGVTAGPEKSALAAHLKQLRPGQITPVPGRSTPRSQFAEMTGLPSAIAAAGLRQPIEGSPFEVVATVSTYDVAEALVGYQTFGLAAFGGLVLLAMGIAFALRTETEDHVRMVVPPPMPVPQISARRSKDFDAISTPPAEITAPGAPEASPDDFVFPSSQPKSAAAAKAPEHPAVAQTVVAPALESLKEPASDPFAHLMAPTQAATGATGGFQVLPSAVPPVAPSTGGGFSFPKTGGAPLPKFDDEDDDKDAARTIAYPLLQPSDAPNTGTAPSPFAAFTPSQTGVAAKIIDPFALPSNSDDGAEDRAESTRVAMIPQELLKATRSSESSPSLGASAAAPLPRLQSIAPVASSGSEEDRHYQEVFRDFVQTREKCGEAADGLTYDKFRVKLLKNKDQLVTKYACKTVRFQVYVKDGKAALKATPVKE